MKNINPKKAPHLLLALLLLSASFLFITHQASAGTLTNTYIRTNRMAAGSQTGWRLVFKTVSAGATSVAVNFNGSDTTTWTGSSGVVQSGANTTSVASCPGETSATALPGTLVATGSSSTLTITGVTALSATTSYCVDITTSTALTIPTANEYHPTVTVGSDSTTVAVRTVSSGTPAADQVKVDAVVPPTFNFSLDGSTAYFNGGVSSATSLLSTTGPGGGSVNVTGARTITISTNAKNGWYIWASNNGTGLTSATAGASIASTSPGNPSVSTLSNGTEGYVLGVTGVTQGSGSGIGNTTAATAFGSNGTTQGGGLDTTLRAIASSTGTANGATVTVKALAAISSLTKAANDYTDTINFVGAGYF